MRETIGWDAQFCRRRPVEKSVLTRDETESSNRARAGCELTKVETRLVAEIDDADGRANGSGLEPLAGARIQAVNSRLILEASRSASKSQFKRLRGR